MNRVILAVLLLVPLTDLIAQEVSPTEVGARVRVLRVWPYDYWVEGSVVAVNAATLVLLEKTYQTTTVIPLSSVVRVEVGKKSLRTGTLTGILRGAGIGVLTGPVIGYAYLHITDYPTISSLSSHGDDPHIGRLIMRTYILGLSGGIGAVIGAGIGALVGVEQWEWKSIPLPLHVGPLPHGGGYLAVRFEFGK